ncbi:MAG: GtrA-like protein [Myxococcaceae bacterium]|nr:GtrA-like protein [Myxococcaceae bacterium]
MIKRVLKSWATLSLAAGAVATAFDLALGSTLLSFGTPTRAAAMAGTTLGSTIAFFLNRYVAFREKKPKVVVPALRFLLVTLVGITLHGQVVVLLREEVGVPWVPAKLIADVCVFTFAQLIVFRYFVFPRPKEAPATSDPSG